MSAMRQQAIEMVERIPEGKLGFWLKQVPEALYSGTDVGIIPGRLNLSSWYRIPL